MSNWTDILNHIILLIMIFSLFYSTKFSPFPTINIIKVGHNLLQLMHKIHSSCVRKWVHRSKQINTFIQVLKKIKIWSDRTYLPIQSNKTTKFLPLSDAPIYPPNASLFDVYKTVVIYMTKAHLYCLAYLHLFFHTLEWLKIKLLSPIRC